MLKHSKLKVLSFLAIFIAVFLSAISIISSISMPKKETLNADENWIYINSVDDLKNVDNNLSGSYKLMTDLDISNINPWKPIGGTTGFSGTFDGNGHTITGLRINREKGSNNYQDLENGTTDYTTFYGVNNWVYYQHDTGWGQRLVKYGEGYNTKSFGVREKGNVVSHSKEGAYSRYFGLFSKINSSAQVVNLKLKQIIIFGNANSGTDRTMWNTTNNPDIGDTQMYAGAICGVNYGSISNVIIEDVCVNISFYFNEYHNGTGTQFSGCIGYLYCMSGGVCGLNYGTIENVEVKCNDSNYKKQNGYIPSTNIGAGITGWVECYGFLATWSKDESTKVVMALAGGIAGQNRGYISYSYFIGEVYSYLGKTTDTGDNNNKFGDVKVEGGSYAAGITTSNINNYNGQVMDNFSILTSDSNSKAYKDFSRDDSVEYEYFQPVVDNMTQYHNSESNCYYSPSLNYRKAGSSGVERGQISAVDYGATSGEYFYTYYAYSNLLYWQYSEMKFNIYGYPIPSAFAYQIDFYVYEDDDNYVFSEDGSYLDSRMEGDRKVYNFGYCEVDTNVSLSDAHINDSNYYEYSFYFNNRKSINYEIDDNSKKFTVGKSAFVYSSKVTNNSDKTYKIYVNNSGTEYQVNINTQTRYLKSGSSYIEANADLSNAISSITKITLNNSDILNEELIEGDAVYSIFDYSLFAGNTSYIFITKDSTNANTYNLYISQSSSGPDRYARYLKIELNKGYSLYGIRYGTTNNEYPVNGNSKAINEYYYNNTHTDLYPAEQTYYLLFQFDTVDLKLGADKGGRLDGEVENYVKSNNTKQISNVDLAGPQYYDRDTANIKTFYFKFLDNQQIVLSMIAGEKVNSSSKSYIYGTQYDAYEFTGWTVYKIDDGIGYYYVATDNGYEWVANSRNREINASDFISVMGENFLSLDLQSEEYQITAMFKPIIYNINLWDTNADDSQSDATNTAFKHVNSSGLEEDGHSRVTISFNIEGSPSFKYYQPEEAENDGSINETLNEARKDRMWAILLKDGTVVGNSNLVYEFNLNDKVLTLKPNPAKTNRKGNWNFVYSAKYINATGCEVVLVTGMLPGSWESVDEGSNNEFSTYTVMANSAKKYTLTVVNDGDGSLWSSGQVGESENILNYSTTSGSFNGRLLMGVFSRGDRTHISSDYFSTTLDISAYNAFPFYNTQITNNSAVGFYKGHDINGRYVNYKANYHTGGGVITNTSQNYFVYNYGYEISGWTISLTLKEALIVDSSLGAKTNLFYLIYNNSTWQLVTDRIGQYYYSLNPDNSWSRNSNLTLKNDISKFPAIYANNSYSSGKIMAEMSQYIDEIFVGKDKDAVLEGMSLSMRPSWEAVEINGTYTGYIYTKSNMGVSTGYRVNQQLFTQGTIKYGEAYSFIYVDSLEGETSVSLASSGRTLAYLNKNSLYCVNNAVWNYYIGTTSTSSYYTYGYNSTHNRYMYTINFTSKSELSDVYKVNLEGDIDWSLGLDLTRDDAYSNYYTVYSAGEKRAANRYNYQSEENGKYVFNWYSYERYKDEVNGGNYLWADTYYTRYFTNASTIGFCYQYNRYTSSPQTYITRAYNANNVQTSLTHNINGLDKLFSDVADKNFLLYLYQEGEARYIYLTANTTAIMPVFYKNGNEKFYKLNGWTDKETNPMNQNLYITGKYTSGLDETEGLTVLSNWSVSNYRVENWQTARYVLTANFYRERYYLNVNTNKEVLLGRYGYGLVYIKDEEDANRYSQVYLAISEEGRMVYYKLSSDQVEIVGNELRKKNLSLVNISLSNGIEEIPIYAGCDIYLLAIDQSKDTEAMGSGEYDELIGYMFKEFGLFKSVRKTNAGMEYAGSSMASNSSYYAYLNRNDLAEYIDKIGAQTGHTFRVDLIYTDIQYDLTIELSPEGNYNSGSFKWANGFAEESGKQTMTMSATVSDQIEYLITYMANAGYEFQENAFSLTWANGNGQTVLRRVNAYLVLTADGKGTEWREDVTGIAEDRILYSKLANADGTFEQTYNWKVYGTWLRLFYYNNQDTSYKVGPTRLGTMHVNTKEIEFKLGIRYYDMDTGEDLAIEEKEVILKVATQPKASLVTSEDGKRKPYGMSETIMYDKPAYVYEREGKIYTAVQSYMYSRSNPSDSSYDRQYYGLPYYTEDLNSKTYNVENNFTMRVNYAVGAIISQAEDERTIYYVFAVKELITIEVEVEYKVGDVNNSERSITLRNSMRKSDKELASYGTSVNAQSLTLTANAEHNESNYLTNGKEKLLTFYSYQGLDNSINNNYDATVRYSGVKYTYNGEEISERFRVTESGKLKIRYQPKPLNVVEVYHISYWDDDVNNEEPIEAVVEGQYLIDQKIIERLPEKKIDNVSAYSEEMTKAYVGAVIRILTEGMGLSSDYDFSYTINGTDKDVYTVTGSDYQRRQGVIQIDYYFDVRSGNLVRYQFNIAGYEEEEDVGTFTMEVVDGTGRTPTAKEIDQARKGVRVLDGKGLKLTLKLNTGYEYVSYTHNVYEIDSITKPNANGEIVLIDNFSTEAGDGGDYVFNIQKETIKVKLEIEQGLNPSEDYTLNNGESEQTSYVNDTITITKANNPAEELVEYYYMVGEDKEVIPHSEGVGELKLTSELLEKLTQPYELTIYVKYINKYMLKVNLGEGSENLGKEIDGEIRRYLTKIGGEETSITEADGTARYYQEGTKIEIEVLLALTDKYTVTISNKDGVVIHQGEDALKFEVTLNEDEELTIRCVANSYRIETTTERSNSLSQINGTNKEVLGTTTVQGMYGTRYEQSYAIEANGGILRSIQIQGNDTPTLTIEVVGRDGEYSLQVRSNEEVSITGNTITVKWQEGEAEKTASISYNLTEGKLTLGYQIQNHSQITLNYLAYKDISQRF